MGVCCIVFDIDGMLNFLNIENKVKFKDYFSIFHVLFAFYAKNSVYKKSRGGGGRGVEIFGFGKTILSHFIRVLCYFQHYQKYWKS